VKQLLIGGETLSVPHVRKGLEQLSNTKIINGYGPTESTTFACCYPIPRTLGDDAASIPIGRPIANTEVYILDAHLNSVPIGVAGELYICGDGLARGYLHRPDFTKERFIANPFSTQAGARLYKTGDQARYLAHGNIEFLGRTDNQVKIRGYRIELGEIEAVLTQHPAVRESAVIAREDRAGDKQLVAYIVPRASAPAISELRAHLKAKLPDYMVPSAFVFLDMLPLTSNGKVDHRALPSKDHDVADSKQAYVAPGNASEQAIADIWVEILAVKRIGVHDNFFELGGHSLLATKVVNRLRSRLKVELSLRRMFEAPTIAELAEDVAANERSGGQMKNISRFPRRRHEL